MAGGLTHPVGREGEDDPAHERRDTGGPDLSDDELAATARSVVGSLATVTMSGPGTVELQPCGITKVTNSGCAACHRSPVSPAVGGSSNQKKLCGGKVSW